MKTSKMTIFGLNYYYSISRKKGSDIAPIIFINGAFQNMHSWKFMNDHFSKFTTTIVADLPGWGKADNLPSSLDFTLYAHAIDKILLSENIDKVNIVSTSFGTPIAIQYAKLHSLKIDHLILTSPLLKIDESLLYNYPTLKNLVEQKDFPRLSNFLFEMGLMNKVEGEKGNIKQYELISSLFKKQILKLSDNKLLKFISNTDRILRFGSTNTQGLEQLNTLVFTGEHDLFTTCNNSESLANQFNTSEYYTIPEADHLFLFERPKFATKLICTFLSRSKAKKDKLALLETVRA